LTGKTNNSEATKIGEQVGTSPPSKAREPVQVKIKFKNSFKKSTTEGESRQPILALETTVRRNRLYSVSEFIYNQYWCGSWISWSRKING
jgi:hypothetical protein